MTTMSYGELRDRILYILDTRKWSARELARRANLSSETHISVIMRGSSPTVDTIAAIAHAAQVSFLWLGTGDGSPQAFDADSAPALPPNQKKPKFPKELESAMEGRDLYPATVLSLGTWAKRGVSEEDWRSYIDMLESTNRFFESKFLTRKAPSHDRVVADSVAGVARAQRKRASAKAPAAKSRRK